MAHTIRGTNYLEQFKDFKLLGRDKDIERISSILMRKQSNSLLLVGPAGVGASALILGLQYVKSIPGTPFDIISKRLIWLDTDSLFSSGDPDRINEDFQRILKMLHRTPESVLIIEDTAGFIERSRDSGNSHFINALNVAVKSGKTQVILEVRDEQLSSVLKWHQDIGEAYTLYDVQEPIGAYLRDIVGGVSTELSKHHGIRIDETAIIAAIELTSKYRENMGLGGAQPKRSISLIDRALSTYRQNAHRKHPQLAELEAKVESATKLGLPSVGQLTVELNQWTKDWNTLQVEINKYHKLQRDAEESLYKLQDELDDELLKQEKRAKQADEEGATDKQASEAVLSFSQALGNSNLDTPKVAEIKARISKFEAAITDNATKHDALVAQANKGLALDRAAVLFEFSQISGINADKLNQNELENLRNLESKLKGRVFGQDEAVEYVANTVKVAQIDTMEETGPKGAYLFLGPSGSGKTELTKALAEALDLELVRFDMSDYMEKHAVAKLIGAPPGYEGFEAGGILTNHVRKNPMCVVLFDEAEKAHPDVFNILLQILSDGQQKDNLGRVVNFRETYVILTSNIGQKGYLDKNMSAEDAKQAATEELNTFFRSELLNRFNGREGILHFNRLDISVIERIVAREITKLNKGYESRGLRVEFSDQAIADFVDAKYDVVRGARGLPGYIKANLRPIIVNQILADPTAQGVFVTTFDKERGTFVVEFEKADTVDVGSAKELVS